MTIKFQPPHTLAAFSANYAGCGYEIVLALSPRVRHNDVWMIVAVLSDSNRYHLTLYAYSVLASEAT